MTTEFILGQVLGFILGLAGSFTSWWVLVHFIVPRIEFGEIISKLPYDLSTGSKSYRIKFKNAGKRGLVDGYVMATLSIKGLRLAKTWNTFRIPLLLSGETAIPIPMMAPNKNRVFRLCLGLSHDLQDNAYLPESIRAQARAGTLTLEALFALGPSRLTIYVAGADAISGARKIFESKRYSAADIRETSFDGLKAAAPAVADAPAAKP